MTTSPLPPDAIAASNVLPAYEASLAFGATQAELEAVIGLTREQLTRADASVPGSVTYAHMEWMYGKADYPAFVIAAAKSHQLASLGVVGLACKTAPTVLDALNCHRRFQHLTNRSASYEAIINDTSVALCETRFGAPRLGRDLISDYALLVAATLIEQVVVGRAPLLALKSVRTQMAAGEREAYETYLGAPIELGAKDAALVYRRELLELPIAAADSEVSAYFSGLLGAAALPDDPPQSLVYDVQVAIAEGLRDGTPTAREVGKRLGLGARTLQRRLQDEGVSFAALLDRVRQQLAQRHLADPKLSLAEVAYLLGYLEQASFYRAFRRWFGETPAGYRGRVCGG